MRNQILLIFPPQAKACEPPAGITKIAGFLRANNQQCQLWDANSEAQQYLLEQKQSPADTWTKRAWKNCKANRQALRETELYENQDRYQRAVRDINRVLAKSCDNKGVALSLADYQEAGLSPHESADLLQAASEYKKSVFFRFYQQRLEELLQNSKHAFVGISLNYLSQALPAFALAGFLKDKYPDCPLIIGGGLVTSWLRSPGWQNPFTELFAQMIAGEGELALLKCLGNDTHVCHSAPDFNDLALTEYLSPGVIIPYSASSGCYWNRCSFCPEKAEGGSYSKLSSVRVVADLKKLIRTYKPTLIHLLDNAVAPSLMRQLIAEPVGADWYGFARVSQELSDPDFCMQLRKAGCVMLKLGIESGSQEVLDEMDKGINLKLVEETLAALRIAGIATYVYLLFGTPAETLSEARETLAFTVRNAAGIGFLNLAVFNLPQNSQERASLQIRDFSTGDLGLYSDFVHPKGWNRKEVRRFLADEFKIHPEIRPILQRDPPFFTSNHAAFMLQLLNSGEKQNG